MHFFAWKFIIKFKSETVIILCLGHFNTHKILLYWLVFLKFSNTIDLLWLNFKWAVITLYVNNTEL